MILHMPVSHSPLRNIIILSSKGFHSAVLRTAFFSLPYSPVYFSVCIPLSFQRTAEKRTGVRVCAPSLLRTGDGLCIILSDDYVTGNSIKANI